MNLRKIASRTWTRFLVNPSNPIALIAFLLSLFLVSANLFPNLSEINSWDEAVYVNSGRLLLEGQWPALAGSPLVALFYALTSLPYLDSTFWLIQSTSLGRVLLYGLLWISAYTVATRFSKIAHPLTMVGLLFVSIIPVSILIFPSDPLFVGLAALALAYALIFIRDNSLNALGLASLFLGLAALARNDGLILGAILILSAPFYASGRLSRWKALATAAAPFLLLVLGYVLFYGVRTGQFELGTVERTYDNFEAGHQSIYAGEGLVNPVLEAKEEARRVFGTAEENQNSILRAIARNPSVYLRRLSAVISGLPSQILSAYGVRLAIPILMFAARGIWELSKRKEFRSLSLLMLWMVPILSGFVITLFRVGHIRFSFYVVFTLAAIGLISALRNLTSRREQMVWGILLFLITLYGVVDRKPAIVYGMIVILGAMMLSLIVRIRWSALAEPIVVPALLFLSAGLLLHGDYPGTKNRLLGESADEQAVQFLVENFDPGTPIAAGSPGPVIAANMKYMGLTSLDVPTTETPEQFLDWLEDQGVDAIYVDASLYGDSPYIWEQISSLIGTRMERIFVMEEGNYQILAGIDD